MRQRSRYVEALPAILATLHGQQDNQGAQSQQVEQSAVEPETIHVYPVEGGAILLTRTPIEQEMPVPPIVESSIASSEMRSAAQPHRRPLHPVVHHVLLLFLFLLLDSIGGILTELMMPTVIITLVPEVRHISMQSTARLGKLLTPITVSESQTVAATGQRHQDAHAAEGVLIFYNGLFTAQFVVQGTVFTDSDGIQVATDQSVTIPANTPPRDGQTEVTAHILTTGATGNIAAGDITVTITNGLLVTNSQFHGGQDERDYRVVTRADIDTAAAVLKEKVTASMTAALYKQLTPTEQLQKVSCPARVSANHLAGDEASQVQVDVSQTCTAITYDSQQLTDLATQHLVNQAEKIVGKGYRRTGDVQVTITKTAIHQQAVILSFTCRGTWIYIISQGQEQYLRSLIQGKHRLDALHILSTMPGIQKVSVSGIKDNAILPQDSQQIIMFVVDR